MIRRYLQFSLVDLIDQIDRLRQLQLRQLVLSSLFYHPDCCVSVNGESIHPNVRIASRIQGRYMREASRLKETDVKLSIGRCSGDKANAIPYLYEFEHVAFG